MTKTLLRILLLLFVLGTSWYFSIETTKAQVCTGSVTCCDQTYQVCEPEGCGELGQPPCVCHLECAVTYPGMCIPQAGQCGAWCQRLDEIDLFSDCHWESVCPACGNDLCDCGETYDTCPADCDPPGGGNGGTPPSGCACCDTNPPSDCCSPTCYWDGTACHDRPDICQPAPPRTLCKPPRNFSFRCDRYEDHLRVCWTWDWSGPGGGQESWQIHWTDDPNNFTESSWPNVTSFPRWCFVSDSGGARYNLHLFASLAVREWWARVRVWEETDRGCKAPGLWTPSLKLNPDTDCTMEPATISGTVYLDPMRASRSAGVPIEYVCSYSGSPLATIDSQPTLHLIGLTGPSFDETITADVSGDYTFADVPANQNYILTITPPEDLTSYCPDGGSLSRFIGIGETVERDFYLSPPLVDPWFQTVAGNVSAQGSINSNIPDSCEEPDCEPYLSLKGDNKNPGLVTYGVESSLNLYEGQASSPENWQAAFSSSTDFGSGYFQRLLRDEVDRGEFDGHKPTGGQTIFTCDHSEETKHRINLGAGQPQKAIVLIEGDFTIKHDIEVSRGNFLIFVVTGNIIIEANVDKVEGIFVSDGSLITLSRETEADDQLLLNGTFVANSFNLGRDLTTANDTTPAELFTYRPDFVFAAPEELRRSTYLWDEVAP